MKKSIFLCVLLVIVFLSSCGLSAFSNHKADDVISKAIYEELGDAVYYQGQRDYPNKQLCYGYLVQEESNDLVYNITVVVNETIEKEKITDKVDIYLYYEIPGGYTCFARLCNYSTEEIEYADCSGLQRLEVTGYKNAEDNCIYNEPIVYVSLPDIKYFKFTKEIQEKAEAEGIDWYEYWPDLESVETF